MWNWKYEDKEMQVEVTRVRLWILFSVCMYRVRSHKHQGQDEPCQRWSLFRVRGEEVVDPSADCGERWERRRPHRHVETRRSTSCSFLQISRDACWLSQVVWFLLALPLINDNTFSNIFLIQVLELFRKYGRLCVIDWDICWAAFLTCSDNFIPLGNVLLFLCDFHSLWLLSFSMQVYMVLKQIVWWLWPARTCWIYEMNRDAAAVCVFYCYAVSCQRLKPIIVVIQLL